MRILVTGARGQLGSDCVEVLSEKHELLALDLPEFDIGDRAAVERTVDAFTPECILNCAAYTRVDDCEDDREAAYRTNVSGPFHLASCAQKGGARIIHISTDYVFDGRKPCPEPYVEEDAVSPVSFYGTSKAEGEKAVRDSCRRHVILRAAWMYGINGRNFPKTILRLALKNPAGILKVVDDQYGSPTWSYRLARQIEKILETDAQGIFHATSEGYCSWCAFAAAFLEEMGLSVMPVPCTSAEYPTRATRPANSILENAALKKKGWNRMLSWKEDLAEFVSLHRDRLLREAQGK